MELDWVNAEIAVNTYTIINIVSILVLRLLFANFMLIRQIPGFPFIVLGF